MEKLETIKFDLVEYRITLQFPGVKAPLVVHFDTPSRRFYFSVIALIITEMKKRGRPEFIHIRRHQKILTQLDQYLSGKNASKHPEGMWAKINMAWRHRLPDLESAALFKVLDRDLISPYEKGGKYRYQCSEAECDAWASLFSYHEDNKWRYKFAFDSASVGLDEISLTLGDSETIRPGKSLSIVSISRPGLVRFSRKQGFQPPLNPNQKIGLLIRNCARSYGAGRLL